MKRLPVDRLVPHGYIFIWVEKEFIQEIVTTMKRAWNFSYVENFVWVKQSVDNTFCLEPYKYFQKSKVTLFIFRRDTELSRKMDIRHQRNPDVYFDFCHSVSNGPAPASSSDGKKVQKFEEKTRFAFNVVETLLPNAVNRKKCLELWGHPQTIERKGWTKIIELGTVEEK